MNKSLKITLNILIFTLITGFGYYMFHSIMSGKKTSRFNEEHVEQPFVSPYQKINSFDAESNISCFDIFNDMVYIALSGKLSVFDFQGKHQRDFEIETEVRDIVVENEMIYLLYPTKIKLLAITGAMKEEWDACSDNTDYCALTTTKDYIFVTDAESKNIVQYDKQGALVRFIKSPKGFIIPSRSFGIISINDTVYCSNSGRHKIESYTLAGAFIASFGVAGMQAGAFAGCCNPVYLEKTTNGNILTSEKGNPRISSYGRDGKFRTVLFNSLTLGGGTAAYRMKVHGENIYIAKKNTISVFCMRVAHNAYTEKSCHGCEKDCPKRININ